MTLPSHQAAGVAGLVEELYTRSGIKVVARAAAPGSRDMIPRFEFDQAFRTADRSRRPIERTAGQSEHSESWLYLAFAIRDHHSGALVRNSPRPAGFARSVLRSEHGDLSRIRSFERRSFLAGAGLACLSALRRPVRNELAGSTALRFAL